MSYPTSPSIEMEDLDNTPFNQEDSLGKAHQLFGDSLSKLLEEPLSNTAKVSVWLSTPSATHQLASFGLRLGRQLRDRWVEARTTEVQLQLEGIPDALVVTLSSAFWNKCPEFKHERIGSWIQSQELPLPWPSRQPYEFEMHRIGTNSFRVLRL